MYTLEDVYKTFPSGCTEDYKILRAFEMGKQSSDKKVRELEAQIEEMKCCANCVFSESDRLNGTFCHKEGCFVLASAKCKLWER